MWYWVDLLDLLQIKALDKHVLFCFFFSSSKWCTVAGGLLITIVAKWKLDLIWETAGWDQTAWFIMVIYVPCSWDSAGGKGMVFTKYVSLCLVSPQLGSRPVFLIRMHYMDTGKTSSQCFWSSQNNECMSLPFSSGEMFVCYVVLSEADRLLIVWVTSSLVSDP